MLLLRTLPILSPRELRAAMTIIANKNYFVAYLAGDMTLYLLQKAARNDMWYWVPVDGAVGMATSQVFMSALEIFHDCSPAASMNSINQTMFKGVSPSASLVTLAACASFEPSPVMLVRVISYRSLMYGTCALGSGRSDSLLGCSICTEGKYSAVNDLPIQANWWRLHNTSYVVEKCKTDDICMPKVVNGSYSACADGHVGALCIYCEDGFALVSGDCQQCEKGSSIGVLIRYIALFFAIVAVVAKGYCGAPTPQCRADDGLGEQEVRGRGVRAGAHADVDEGRLGACRLRAYPVVLVMI